jgi:hypothetical protein
MDDSIRAEMPKIKKRTLAEQKARTSWAGADKTIAKKRPKSILESPTPVRPKPRAVPKPRLKPTPKLPAPKPEAQLPWYDPGRPLPKSYGQLREEYDRLGTAIDAKYADLSNPMDVPKVMLMQKRRNAIGNAYREIYNKELAKIKALPEAERMNAHLRGVQTQWERDKFVARYKREEAALEAKRKKVLAGAKRSEKRVEALQRKSDKMGDEWEELYKKNLVLEEQIAAVETQPELVGLPQAQEAVRASLREEVEKNFQRRVFLSGEIDKTVTARTTAIRNRGRNALKAIQPEDPVPVKYAKEGINKEVRQQLNEADKYLKTMTSREAVQSDSLQVTARHLGKEVEQRACCAGDTIYLAQEEGMATIVHETGHALEHGNAKIGAMARGFRLQRVGKEAPIKFIDKWPDSGYRPSEWGCEGGFSSAWEKLWIGKDQIEKSARYTGKVYEHGSTEIVSMGMELLTRDPVAFAQGDPAFFNFMTGVLDGSLLR